jgi:hypothetical protein
MTEGGSCVTGPDSVETARAVVGEALPSLGGSLGYESPEAVLADDTLAPSQKRRFLEDWRTLLCDHLAGNEVATADAPAEADLRARIDLVLQSLAEADRDSGTAD